MNNTARDTLMAYAATLLLAPLAATHAADFHVAPSADDTNPGTQAAALCTNATTAQGTDARGPKVASVRSYSTRFQLNEDPISEGGKWINGGEDGIDWHNVITKNGVAYGAVSKGAYTDPTALLAGTWGKNPTVKAKVFSRNQTEKYYQEVEIRLRSMLTRQRCTGYEVFWRCLKTQNAYAQIVRWNGKVGD